MVICSVWSAVINGHFVNFPQVTTIYRLDCICYTYPENIQDLTKQINILFVGSFKACNNDYSLPGGSFQVDPLSPKVHYPWEVRNAPTLVVIGTDRTGSSKSNNHTITIMTAPSFDVVILTHIYVLIKLLKENKK